MTQEERIYNQIALAACNEIRAYSANEDPLSSSNTNGYIILALSTFVDDILLEEVEANEATTSRKYKILMNLRSMDVIDFMNDQDIGRFDSYGIILKNHQYIDDMRRWLYYTISPAGNTPRIVYSLNSGRGLIDGARFRLMKHNKKLFSYLLKHQGEHIKKDNIWHFMRASENLHSTDGTIMFNAYITNLRRALKNISKDYLYIKNDVYFSSNVLITDDSDLKTLEKTEF